MLQEPPAASIFSLAAALKPCALTVNFFEISPRARILTGCERFASPFVAAENGFVDDVIEPRLTRPRVIRALRAVPDLPDGPEAG